MARKPTPEEIEAAWPCACVKRDRRASGVALVGFDPGVSARIIGDSRPGSAWDGSHLDFDHRHWQWLEPLLVELRDRRQGQWISEKVTEAVLERLAKYPVWRAVM